MIISFLSASLKMRLSHIFLLVKISKGLLWGGGVGGGHVPIFGHCYFPGLTVAHLLELGPL